MSKNQIVIIGAGLAGLSAARTLKQRGHDVLVLEKAKSVGGRMATRRLKKGQADHGALSFTAKNNHFVTLKNELLRDGLIREWYRGLPAPHEVANTGIYPRYCGAKSMNSVAKRLADGLNVKTNTEVNRVTQQQNGWLIETANDDYHAAGVILTAPVPQSLKLLEKGGVELDQYLKKELNDLTYHSCITLMARFDKETKLPAPGMLHLSDGIVEWISDNQQKAISDAPVLTIHCHYRYSSENFDEDNEKLTNDVLQSVQKWLPGVPEETQIQRWRYAKPKSVASSPRFVLEQPAPLVFAGDAFVDGRIEGAYLSGRAGALALVELVGSEATEVEATAQVS